MNKRNAAATAAAGEQEGTSPPTAEDSNETGAFTLPNSTTSERVRNPFADYDDGEDDDSNSGSDDGEVDTLAGDAPGAGSSDNAWNRGSWWRGVVRSARGGGSRRLGHDGGRDVEVERFGDGRDDDSSDEEGGRRLADDDDIEDEEFGDFAMPEVEERVGASGIDANREGILHKPMPLHPTTSLKSSTISPFTSLWPFSREKKEGEGSGSAEGSNASTPTGGLNIGGITEEPVELTREEEAMISEDGKRINRAVEATRRTSIEDPDEDEVDVGEEVIVHRTAGVR